MMTTNQQAPPTHANRTDWNPGQRQDPYLTWAGLTGCRYLASGRSIRLAGKLLEGRSLSGLIEAVRESGLQFTARPIGETRFFTAQLSGDPVSMPGGTLFDRINVGCDRLLSHADFVLAEPGMRAIDVPPGAPTINRPPSGESPARCPQSVVVGVIDGPCGFANLAFCAEEESRLDYFWDQGCEPAPADPVWGYPAGFGYGRELCRNALDGIARGLWQQAGAGAWRGAAEQALYRTIGHALPEDADWSHGTHVLDTVIGDLAAGGRPPRGAIYVQLPASALRDTSARWAASNVLDAIDYIVTRAGDSKRIVVNISLAAYGGPHDGSSLLERAIDALVDAHRGRLTIVVAAGNAGRIEDDGTGAVKACHAHIELDAAGSRGSSPKSSFTWDIDVKDTTESFLEIWIPNLPAGRRGGGIQISMRHESLAAMRLDDIGPDTSAALSIAGNVVATIVNATGRCKVPNGDGGMALIALGHTSDGFGVAAPAGRWTIEVVNDAKCRLIADAWSERRDLPGELQGFRSQYGFTDAHWCELTTEGSTGTLANGRRTVVVGAAEPKNENWQPSIFSSERPRPAAGLRALPDIYAAGRRSASGFLTGSRKELSGTSMAAAQVSAAAAEAGLSAVLQKLPVLQQLHAIAIGRAMQAVRPAALIPRGDQPIASRTYGSGSVQPATVPMLPPLPEEPTPQ